MKRKILIVDDEPQMLTLLKIYLENHQYQCILIEDPSVVVDFLKTNPIDIVLLDIMMPSLNGWDLLKEIRQFSNVPVLYLTARTNQEDIIKGLRLGADDFITKPFDEEVLVAKLEAVLRRYYGEGALTVEGLTWDFDTRKVSFSGHEILLTPKEFALLGLFLTNQRRVFSREVLVDLIWTYGSDPSDRAVDSHIRNLRDKLRKAGFPIEKYLHTIYGSGYKWSHSS
ncbi:DNA-binding response OmpR family regulator [Bacillus oleivorans]|uniref:DNA-binding response OmpR family regulator n=1 Tax=Bacillus oleivorans TaxID=1448271 RepID=A0A285D424_9BACI|nr:response regulator transcription factor [Bacillus oleivorans]SNX74445.1 DNA-binding response OmpR family regulator [Bacillus oleivorans]